MTGVRTAGVMLAGLVALGSAADVGGAQGTGAPASSVRTSSAKATADIRDAAGRSIGEALLEQREAGVQITGTLGGLPPGTRAIHIHEVGACEPPFESAGGHYNPTGNQHGKDNPAGPHAGDLPNLEVPSSGRVKLDVTAKGLSLDGTQGLLDGDGAALVIHGGGDDYRTDPTGGAGKRLACGVIHR